MGHTQTHQNYLDNLDAVHFFELELRKNLPTERQGLVKELISTKHDDDVILSVKKQLSDSQYSQLPMVLVPGPWLKDLRDAGPGFTPRHPVSQNTQDELMKTALKVEATPWKMVRASQYLKQLAANDFPQVPSCRELPPKDSWKDIGQQDLTADFVQDEHLSFSNRAPAPVTVRATAAKSKAAAAKSIPLPAAPPLTSGSPTPGSDSPPAAPIPASPVVSASAVSAPSEAGSDMAFPAASKAKAKSIGLKRPAAAVASGLPAGAKAKVSAEIKAVPKKRASPATVQIPPGVTLGCHKCRHSRAVGCAACRTKNGLKYDPETGMWS